MASAQRSPASGRKIPGTMTFNLDDGSFAKPILRRPMTACEACRAAKVRCSGQQPCERCRHRETVCVHPPPRPSQRITATASTTVVRTPFTSAELSTTDFQRPEDPAPSTRTDWPVASNPVDDIDWNDEDLSWFVFGTQPTSIAVPMPSEMLSSRNQELNTPNTDMLFPNPFNPFPNDLPHSQTTEENQVVTSLPELPLPSNHSRTPPRLCHCRCSLILCVPILEYVIQSNPPPQLDKMLKATEEVIQRCQTVMQCTTCHIRPADLVCIVTVFQQTAACFDHISKSGLHDTMKMGLGDYQVSPLDDLAFKRMLVRKLIKRANALLDSLSELGQKLFLAPAPENCLRPGRSPACLNQVNLDYVREVVTAFKKFFRLIMDVLDEQGEESS